MTEEVKKQEIKKLPQRWDKLESMAMVAVRLSEKGLPGVNRRYQVVNLHSYVAELFSTAKLDKLDLNFQRRELDLRIQALCMKFTWSDLKTAMRYANDAWEHIRDAKDARMFLRKHQAMDEPKQFIDDYLKGWK